MKELIRIKNVLEEVYKNDLKQLEKYKTMGAGFEEMAEYNRGRAAATDLAINLIEQEIKYLRKKEAETL